MKLACDADFPCETCLLQGATCTVTRIDKTVDPADSTLGSTVAVRLPTLPIVNPALDGESRSSTRGRGSLSFLLNYVHPENTSLASAFGVAAATQDAGSLIPLDDDSSLSDLDHHAYLPDVFTSYSPGSIFQFFLGELDSPLSFPAEVQWPIQDGQLSIGPSDPLFSPLQGAANNLLDELTHFSSCWSPHHIRDCPQESLVAGFTLFTAGRISALVEDYFLRWNHHSPIIHAASFNISTAHTPLLLAVCLTSALLDPSSDDAAAARGLLDLAEDYVFEHRGFKGIVDTSVTTDTPQLGQALPAVQAAFSIAQIQLRQGSHSKRESIRDHRFDQLVAAVKRLGLHLMSNDLSESLPSEERFDWNMFGIDQAGARLVFGIYNLDVSFSTLYDKPPRLFVEEMQLPLPCSLDAFMATTADTCYEACIHAAVSPSKTLSNALKALYTDQDQDETKRLLETLNTLDLFIVILGMYTYNATSQ